MTTELQTQKKIIITPEQLELIKNTVAKDATPNELALYFYDCQRRGVHPLDRLLHFTKRGGKYTPIVSIDYMRSRAAETGQYAGVDDAIYTEDANGNVVSATVTIYRFVDGQKVAFTGTAWMKEYFPDDEKMAFMWKKMPRGQLSKCAEALAQRKGFPQETGGLYVDEEMQQAAAGAGTGGLKPPERKSASVPALSADDPSSAAVFVVDIKVVTGKKKIKGDDGKEKEKGWTRYDIKASNDIEYKTFSESDMKVAEQAKATGKAIQVKAEEGKFGFDLKSIELLPDAEVVRTPDQAATPDAGPSREEALFNDLREELNGLQYQSDVDKWLAKWEQAIAGLGEPKATNLRYMANTKKKSLRA